MWSQGLLSSEKVVKLIGRGFMTVEFFWKALLFGRQGIQRKSLCLQLQIFKWFQFKIMFMPQWHSLSFGVCDRETVLKSPAPQAVTRRTAPWVTGPDCSSLGNVWQRPWPGETAGWDQPLKLQVWCKCLLFDGKCLVYFIIRTVHSRCPENETYRLKEGNLEWTVQILK